MSSVRPPPQGLARLRSVSWLRRPLIATLLLPALLIAAYVLLVPPPDPSFSLDTPGTAILGSGGEVIERDVERGIRIPVALDEIAPVMIAATIAAEDQRFRRHPGVDPLAVARAAWRFRDEPSGASTITQQLARHTYLAESALPLPLRKAREMWLALRLEAHYSKDEVLALYLNEVYYGRGAYGVEAAARAYFGVSAAHLDLAQAAFLAGLPRSPSRYDSPEGERAARDRQAYVLDRMVATGVIDEGTARAARSRRLAIAPADPPTARHLAALVYDELDLLLPEARVRDGLVIETSIELDLQRDAERSVARHLARLDEHRASNAAVVVLDPRDSRLLALVGSADYEVEAGQINMALAPRQPGSALKPLLYAAALEQGSTAASMLLDVPTTYDTPSGPYRPVNYDLRYRGPVSLRVALASSLNVPAVRTQEAIGQEALLEIAHRLGLRTLTAAEVYGPALTLGGGEVRLIDLAGAYGVLASGGHAQRPWVVERVRDHTGEVLYERAPAEPVRVMDEAIAFILADILADPEARAPGFGRGSVLETPFRAAVKTGTSSDFTDNWTVGFTPDRVVGVWAGNTDHSPMVAISGLDGAAPIWRDVMVAAMEGRPRPRVAPPPSVTRAEVCPPAGLLPGADCPATAHEWFLAGTEPQTTESYYQRDAVGQLRIDPPVAARAWAREAGWALASSAATADADGFAGAVQIVSPRPGSVIYAAPELARQEALLRASVPPGTQQVEFYVNGDLAGRVSGEDPRLRWPLEPGRHQLRVAAYGPGGNVAEASAEYEVREQ